MTAPPACRRSRRRRGDAASAPEASDGPHQEPADGVGQPRRAGARASPSRPGRRRTIRSRVARRATAPSRTEPRPPRRPAARSGWPGRCPRRRGHAPGRPRRRSGRSRRRPGAAAPGGARRRRALERLDRQIGGQLARGAQRGDQRVAAPRQVRAGARDHADADVEHVLLGEVPAVAVEVRLDVQLGRRRDAAQGLAAIGAAAASRSPGRPRPLRARTPRRTPWRRGSDGRPRRSPRAPRRRPARSRRASRRPGGSPPSRARPRARRRRRPGRARGDSGRTRAG